MKKLLFVAPARTAVFYAPLVRRLAASYDLTALSTEKPDAVLSAAAAADIIYSAEGLAPLAGLARNRGSAVLIVGIQGEELLNDDFRNVQWKNVDGVVFAAPHLRELAHEIWPSLIDAHPFHTAPGCAETAEPVSAPGSPGRNFAFFGPLTDPQGIDLLLLCFQAALRKRPDALLHIAGAFRDPSGAELFRHHARALSLETSIRFYESVEDPAVFLRTMHYLFHCAPFAGCPPEIPLALANGVMPLVHHWRGAKPQFDGYVFGSLSELLPLLEDSARDPAACRAVAAERFSADRTAPGLAAFFDGLALHRKPAGRDAAMAGLAAIGRSRPEAASSAAPARFEPAEAWPFASAEFRWDFPAALFTAPHPKRIQLLLTESRKQKEAGKFQLAENTLLRACRLNGYADDSLLQEIIKLYEIRDEVPGIRAVLKRFAVSALESGNTDRFLHLAYLSNYAENLFSKRPNYRFAGVDEDLQGYLRMAVAAHPLNAWVRENRRPLSAGKRALRVGFVLEGLDSRQIPIRTYLPLAAHRDRARFELFVYSRWFFGSPLAQQQNHRETAVRFQASGCVVRTPESELSPMAQVEFLARAVVQDKIDILVFQTSYFVPVYNFLARLHTAPFQAEVEHQQPEFSRDMDLFFVNAKQALDAAGAIAPPVPAPAPPAETAPALSRAALGIPTDATVLVSANTPVRYGQKLFWEALTHLLQQHPKAWFIAVGLSSVNELVRDTPEVRRRILTPGLTAGAQDYLKISDIYLDLFPAGTLSPAADALHCGLPLVGFAQNPAVPYAVNSETPASAFYSDPDLTVPYGDIPAWMATVSRLISEPAWRNSKAVQMQTLSRHHSPEAAAARFFAELEHGYLNKMKKEG